MRKALLIFASFILISNAFVPQAKAETLTVALTTRAPWRMTYDNTPSGIEVEILLTASRRANLDLNFIPTKFSESIKLSQKGKIDIISGILRTPKREKYLTYIAPPFITSESKAFYVVANKATSVTRYENLRALLIAVKRGASYFPQFDHDGQLRKRLTSGLDESFNLLRHNKVGAVIADEAEGDWWLSKHPTLSQSIAKAPLKYRGYQPLFIAFSKKSPRAHHSEALGNALASMVRDGSIHEILRRYGAAY